MHNHSERFGFYNITIVLCAILMVALCGCNKPLRSSAFLNINTKNGWSEAVSLVLEMDDTTHAQQINICMRITTLNMNENCCIPVLLNIESPAGKCYTDTLELPLRYEANGNTYKKHNGRISIQWPYRENVINREAGDWKFTFIPHKIQHNSIYRNISGLGISCKREEK